MEQQQKPIVEVKSQMPKGKRALLEWVQEASGARLPNRWLYYPGAEVRRICIKEGLVEYDAKTSPHYTLTEGGKKVLDEDVAKDKNKELPEPQGH